MRWFSRPSVARHGCRFDIHSPLCVFLINICVSIFSLLLCFIVNFLFRWGPDFISELSTWISRGYNKTRVTTSLGLISKSCLAANFVLTARFPFHSDANRKHMKRHDNLPGINFIALLSTPICLAWNFSLDKNRNANQMSTWFSGQANTSWIPARSNIQQMEICLIILFLSWKKFHDNQFFVLSSSMKLGPALTALELTTKNYKPMVNVQDDRQIFLLTCEIRLQ